MKKVIICGLLAFGVASTLFLSGFLNAKKDQVRHVVAFKYKESSTKESIEKVNRAFADLKNKIPGIVSFEYGINDSPENRHQGFTHIYLLTFENAQARDTYLPHPEHEKFGALLARLEIIEDVFVVDYQPVDLKK